MPYCTPYDVRQKIKVSDKLSDDNLDHHITTASALMSVVESKDVNGVLTVELKKEIETYLAAFFYATLDLQESSKNTGGASASFQGQTGDMLKSNFWGQRAIMLDITGTLASLNELEKRGLIGMHWLGKAKSQHTTWIDRNY